MTSKAREELLLDSSFYQDLNSNLNSNNAFSDQGKFGIEQLDVGVDQTRLFNDEFVQWGVMRVKSNQDADNYKDFLFVIDEITQEFASLNLQQVATNSIEETKERQRDVF